jgi:hypothetical protein
MFLFFKLHQGNPNPLSRLSPHIRSITHELHALQELEGIELVNLSSFIKYL